MARKAIDKTGNEPLYVALSKLEDNFVDLYANGTAGTDPSVTTITTSGNATIGGSAAVTSAVTAATVTTTGLTTVGSAKLDTGTKTATASSGAATLNKSAGVITSEALTTAAGATYTLTLTNSTIAAADQVFAFVNLGAGTGGIPAIASVAPASGSVVIIVQNIHASAAFNAAIKIGFMVLKN